MSSSNSFKKTRKNINYSPRSRSRRRSRSTRRSRSRSRRRSRSRHKSREKPIKKNILNLNVNDIFFSQQGISSNFKDKKSSVLTWYDNINLTILNIKNKKNPRNEITNKIEKYDKTFKNKKKYSKEDLILLGVPSEFFNLGIFSRINKNKEKIYISCDNRRLCLLKKLYNNNIFDGIISVEEMTEQECSIRHIIDEPISKNTFIRGTNINCL